MKLLANIFFALVFGSYLVWAQTTGLAEWRVLALQALPAFLIYQLWLHYAAVMNVKRVLKLGLLSGFNRRMGTVAEYAGLVLDFSFNLLATLFLWERPREWLFSGRVTRLIASDEGWRGARALWWRVNVLDQLDPAGIHTG